MNSIENFSRKKIGKETVDKSFSELNENDEVKHAMAKELLEMGLHPRSVERILNIRLDKKNT